MSYEASATVRTCACGQGEPYDLCCGRLHRHEAAAVTAEQLMRSRFTAFVVADLDYLAATWHPSTRPVRLQPDSSREWTRLEILGCARGGLLDSEGTVEFRAHYRADGRDGVQRETSRFVRDSGRWLYLDAAG